MTEAFAHRVDTLRTAQARLEAAQAAVEVEAAGRDALVHSAIAGGMTHAEIGRATGLTRARIGQIALQDRKASTKGKNG